MQVIEKLRAMRLARAAEIVENGIDETLSYYAMPAEHWRCLRTTDEIDKSFLPAKVLFLRNGFWRPCRFSDWLCRTRLFPAGKEPLIGSLGLFRCGSLLVAD